MKQEKMNEPLPLRLLSEPARPVALRESRPVQERMSSGKVIARREQTITAKNIHELQALLKTEKRWRRIGKHSEIRRIVPRDGGPAFYAVKVVRLRDKGPRWPWMLGGLIAGAGALAGLGVMVWQSRAVWLSLAGFLAVCWALTHVVRGGGSGGCRCPFCGLLVHR
jgi:hypothetical protein